MASTGNVYSDLRGVHTELYKLNIYSGPSGRFKSHVDTPRGMTQFGSLVVCLPHEHKSGNLVVRHGSQNMDFDFASQSHVPVVQWAAFYSNCEHEVLEVESGHRITLTYNLYARLGAGQLNNRLSAIMSL